MAKKKRKTKLRKEIKKKLRRTHKLSSNKLIYAVAAGLAIVLVVFIIVATGGDRKPVNKEKLIMDTIDYLKKNSSITDVRSIPEENKGVIVYDSDMVDESKPNVDFKQMARFAGIRLSHELKDEEVKILLEEVNRKVKSYLVTVKNGEVIDEKLLE